MAATRLMAPEPCPACQRGDHQECWGVEAPPGMRRLNCPCEMAMLAPLPPIAAPFCAPAGLTVAQILESLLSVRSTSPDQIARMERQLFEQFGLGRPAPPPSAAELAAARASLRSVVGRLEGNSKAD